MRRWRGRRPWLVAGLAALTLSGCAAPAARPAPPLRVTGAFAAELQGRAFSFLTLEGRRDGGPLNRFLQIDGDGLTVSFHVSSPPFVPTIRGEAVHVGGHAFAVTATPNLFLVDGQPHTLPPGSLHIFSDGEYAGSRDQRLPAR